MDGISRFTFHASRCARFLLGGVLLFLASGLFPTAAQSPSHAALIVDFGDGRVVVRVVAFAGETISGVDLLQQSGLDVAVMSNLGGGAALCAVEGVGCAPTPQDCFCQCRGTPCRYWSYFHLQEGAWVYAGMGAADHALHDGDVDGWVWGDGRTPPPLLTWEEIWAQAGAAQPTALPPPSTTPLPRATAAPSPIPAGATATGAPATVAPPSLLATALPAPTPPPTPSGVPPTAEPTAAALSTAAAVPSSTLASPARTPAAGAEEAPAAGFSWGAAAAFGGLVLLLVVLALWARQRRRPMRGGN